jgi:hypothetical protein
VSPFALGDDGKRDLAKVLGLTAIPSQVSDAITEAITCYKATEAGSPETTIGNTLAALDELKKKGLAYQKAVARLANDMSGVDYTTHAALQSSAKAVLNNQPGAEEALARSADARSKELREHERAETAIEPLRFVCGVLRLIFNHAAAPEKRCTEKECWHHCRLFAMEVFTVADINHADFDAHPERLTKYLGADVTVDASHMSPRA